MSVFGRVDSHNAGLMVQKTERNEKHVRVQKRVFESVRGAGENNGHRPMA